MVDPSTIARNTQAYLTGKRAEAYAQERLTGIEWVGGSYDALYDGIPLEVKGCLPKHSMAYRGENQTRTGQIRLDAEQHKELCELGGKYFCVVLDDEEVFEEFFVRAERIIFKKGSLTKAVSWKSLAELAEAVA